MSEAYEVLAVRYETRLSAAADHTEIAHWIELLFDVATGSGIIEVCRSLLDP